MLPHIRDNFLHAWARVSGAGVLEVGAINVVGATRLGEGQYQIDLGTRLEPSQDLMMVTSVMVGDDVFNEQTETNRCSAGSLITPENALTRFVQLTDSFNGALRDSDFEFLIFRIDWPS